MREWRQQRLKLALPTIWRTSPQNGSSSFLWWLPSLMATQIIPFVYTGKTKEASRNGHPMTTLWLSQMWLTWELDTIAMQTTFIQIPGFSPTWHHQTFGACRTHRDNWKGCSQPGRMLRTRVRDHLFFSWNTGGVYSAPVCTRPSQELDHGKCSMLCSNSSIEQIYGWSWQSPPTHTHFLGAYFCPGRSPKQEVRTPSPSCVGQEITEHQADGAAPVHGHYQCHRDKENKQKMWTPWKCKPNDVALSHCE